MGQRFAKLAFTKGVKLQQELHGSRRQYARVEDHGEPGDRLGAYEKDFIQRRQDFYIATQSETGWPYIQYRGGPKGFVRVLDDRTIGFADLSGNKQYITTGNLANDDRVCLFFMDYVVRERLKIFGHARTVEGTAEAEKLIQELRTNEPGARVERAVLIRVEAFDWNCPQHITQRFTLEELQEIDDQDLEQLKETQK